MDQVDDPKQRPHNPLGLFVAGLIVGLLIGAVLVTPLLFFGVFAVAKAFAAPSVTSNNLWYAATLVPTVVLVALGVIKTFRRLRFGPGLMIGIGSGMFVGAEFILAIARP